MSVCVTINERLPQQRLRPWGRRLGRGGPLLASWAARRHLQDV